MHNHAASDLIKHCLSMCHKNDAMFMGIWVNTLQQEIYTVVCLGHIFFMFVHLMISSAHLVRHFPILSTV